MSIDHAPHRGNDSEKGANRCQGAELPGLGKAHGLNLSGLAEAAKAQHGRQWLDENRDAIRAFNRRVEAQGVFSDGSRFF